VKQSPLTDPTSRLVADRWQLIRPIGSGAAASVYLAKDLQTGEEHALKLLSAELSSQFGFRSRFVSEAKAMSRLRHPNIARVYAWGEDQGECYSVMEYAPGGCALDRLTDGKPYDPLVALRVCFEVLKAVRAAHKRQIIHRDIKPSNILFAADGSVRLTDFGIARYLDGNVPHRTITGASMGTLGYMAPEQGRNARQVGVTADFYAVGATLFVMLARKNPLALLGADVNPGVLLRIPLPVRFVITKACADKPESRYQSAREMAFETAKARDVIAGGRGEPRVTDVWMAELDDQS